MSGYKKKTSVNIGSSSRNTGVSSTASGGGSREDSLRAQHGQNYEAWKFRMAEHAKRMQERIAKMKERGAGGSGFFGGIMNGLHGAMDTVTDTADIARIEAQAKLIELQNQQSQTKVSDLDPKMLEGLDENTLLRFAFSPEDMAALDLNGEHDAIAEVRSVLTINNPTKELMAHLASTGQFEDVVWSGHGSEDGMWITNEEGQSELLPAKDMANMFKDTSVKEMLLNVCDGGAKVDDALNAAGIDTFAYQREIQDKEAIEDATQFAEAGTLDAIDTSVEVEGGEVKSGGRHQRGNPFANLAGMSFPGLGGMGGFGGLGLRKGFGGMSGFDFSGLDFSGLDIPGTTTPAKAPTPKPALTGTASKGLSGGMSGIAKTVAASGAAHAGLSPRQEGMMGPSGPARAGLRYSQNMMRR